MDRVLLDRVEEKISRKKKKIAHLEASLKTMEDENLHLMQEKELVVEQVAQLTEEIQFMRDSRMDDLSTNDHERLEQLDLIQKLRARETELQDQLEEQQRKWAHDRTHMNQQVGLAVVCAYGFATQQLKHHYVVARLVCTNSRSSCCSKKKPSGTMRKNCSPRNKTF